MLSFLNNKFFRWSFGILLWELSTMGKKTSKESDTEDF